MTRNTFSVIIPTWNRKITLSKAIDSVLRQSYQEFEIIVINDGSDDGTAEVLKEYQERDKRIKVITHKKPRERAIGWNKGMRMAKNEWICFLDSDDEWIYGYLEIMNHNINLHPDYSAFHFGQVLFSLIGTTIKLAVDLEEDDKEGWGMKHFDTGKVGAGGFIFKRECLETAEYLPDVDNLFDLANWFGERVKKYWKDRELDGPVPLYNRDDRWCGNPWGQDYALFWLITRKFKSKKIPVNPYIVYIRTENWEAERAIHGGLFNN